MTPTREQILSRRPVTTETIPAPELGDGATLTVRRLSAADFMALSAKGKAEPDKAYLHWITATVVDDAGRKVFSDDDAAALAELDITLIERLTDAAQRLNVAKKADSPNPAPRPAASPSPSR